MVKPWVTSEEKSRTPAYRTIKIAVSEWERLPLVARTSMWKVPVGAVATGFGTSTLKLANVTPVPDTGTSNGEQAQLMPLGRLAES
jgi:hypothetical protein